MLKDSYTCFNVSIEDKVAHIQMSRPDEMNTMNREFWTELPEIVEEINNSASARAIVISSTGKHFCAGMELSVFGRGDPMASDDPHVRAEQFRSNIRHIQHSFNILEEARMPVLIATHGGVIGGAVDFISACDIRWCTADAFFSIQEINIAMTADVGTFPRLQRLIPEGWVREMAYTGRRLPAKIAREIGLVNEVFDTHEEMMAFVMDTAREIASKNPLAVTGSKVMINYGRDHNTQDTLDYIGVWNASMLAPKHMQEAFKARTEKRDPEFPDLGPLRTTPL